MKAKILSFLVSILLVMYVGLSTTQASVSNDTICKGSSITIGNTYPDGFIYSWIPGNGSTPQITVAPITTTMYIETVLNISYQIIHIDTFNIIVKPRPTVLISSPNGANAVCVGGSLQLIANSDLNPVSYLWSTGATTQQVTVYPTVSPTIYSVTVTYNGCSNTAAFTVYIQSPPMIYDLTGDSTYCAGQPGVTIGLYGSEGDCHYTLYQNNVSVNTINGNGFPLTFGIYPTGTYTVKGFKTLLGCEALMNGTLHINTLPLPQAAGTITGFTTVCQNTTATYFTPAIVHATSYDWSIPTGATITLGQGTPAITVFFGPSSVSGNIKVRGHNDCGDGAYSSLPIIVNVAPTLMISATDTVICAGENVTLTATTNASSVLWNDGSTQNPRIVSPSTPTVYVVMVIGANNCTTTGSILITAHALPTVGLVLSPNQFCRDQNKVALVGGSPSIGGHYTSSQGCVILNDTLSPPLSFVGTYAVTYTFTNSLTGCSNSATDLVTINPVPEVHFYVINATISTDTPPFDLMTFVSPTGGSFSGPGTLPNSSMFYPVLAGGGNHVITYTYTHPVSGCSASEIQYVPVNPVGIDEAIAAVNAITMFPNPAVHELNLMNIDTKEIHGIHITNLLGETVFLTNIVTKTMTIDISSYTPGTYFITFINADGFSKGKRFMKR